MKDDHGTLLLLSALHYVYPFSIFIFYTSASLISVCVTRKEFPKPPPRNGLYGIAFCVMLGILGAHVAEAVCSLVASINSNTQSPSQDAIIGSVLSNNGVEGDADMHDSDDEDDEDDKDLVDQLPKGN
ncbi:MAG: hypothetical protein M1813_007396 [Trichoglossum hirsutum]|nr:MAG: hypothetical protein M1813_007396 [Trichoglossum hirsutum]